MIVTVEVLETNIPELKVKTVAFNCLDGVITFSGSSPFKSSKIMLAAASSLTMLDSDKYNTVAKINFGEDLYFSFKSPTDPYIKYLKHLQLTHSEAFKITEQLSIFVGVGILFLALLILSGVFGGDNGKTDNSKQTSPVVSAEKTGAAQMLIKRSGYKCDSVSHISQSSWDGSYRVTCNDDYYAYSIDDDGGNWVVTVN
ncbi:hypothetical protein HNW13_002390 [Shewanella sp. BF02_Schw]|jgi:hypothetical protein|uniref:hypothetical protein n=1 Tax=Shewanella sp. BF02_Schw TaxID=394908 RepID=UPI00177C5189|nr:hypothetical protein [Shewanella sp. BF02_Schw]MBO1894640.1 hypothetical protein [Shewanella sp. BF02_Schw]